MSDPHDIVPEGFDIREARRASTTTPDEERLFCPVCESTAITPRSRTGWWSEYEYRCRRNSCRARFDDPLTYDEL